MSAELCRGVDSVRVPRWFSEVQYTSVAQIGQHHRTLGDLEELITYLIYNPAAIQLESTEHPTVPFLRLDA